MNKFERKLVLLLADPDLSDVQFHEAARLLSSPRIDRCIESAYELRKHMQHLFRTNGVDEHTAEVISRIQQLLEDVGISKTHAIREIARELDYHLPSRSSFENGISRLIRATDPRTVLSAAERMRNRVAHGTKKPWALKAPSDEKASGTT